MFAGALGLEIGLAYDLFRIIRRVWRCNFTVVAGMDLLFWGFTGYRTFEIMHTYSNGTLRWFAIFGTMLLLAIYMRFFSKYVVRTGIILLAPIRIIVQHCKKGLTKILKLSIIRIRRGQRKGEEHGKKCSLSDKIPQ